MKILVVEDEPKVATFIKEGLVNLQHEVDVAYDGQMGEKLALKNPYQVIILDIIIPVISGLELCKRIKRSKPDVPVLMLTALGTTDDKVTGFEAGADDYLVKPFEFRELVARINALSKRPGEAVSSAVLLRVADLELDVNILRKKIDKDFEAKLIHTRIGMGYIFKEE